MKVCEYRAGRCLRTGRVTATGTGSALGHPAGRGAARGGSADPSGEANDLGRPDGAPDDGFKLAGPDRLQLVLEIRGAGTLDIETPHRAAPARVPPAVGGRAVNLDHPRGGCQAALVQLQAVVTGVADDQGDRDHVLGHGIARSL